MTNNDSQDLVDAVATWLAFEQVCGRRRLLSESLLMVPLYQFCRSRGWTLVPQRPVFDEAPSGRGRPQAVDYEITAGRQPLAWMESKYGWPPTAAILADIAKLLLRRRQKSVGCWWLLAAPSSVPYDKAISSLRGEMPTLLTSKREWTVVGGASARLWNLFSKQLNDILGRRQDRPGWHQFVIRHAVHADVKIREGHVVAALWEVALRPWRRRSARGLNDPTHCEAGAAEPNNVDAGSRVPPRSSEPCHHAK